MAIELKLHSGHLEYDEAVDKVYLRLAGEFEYAIVNAKSPIEEAKERLVFWRMILFGKSEGSRIAEEIGKIFKIDGWDPIKVQAYATALFEGREDILLDDEQTDLKLLCVTKAVIFLLDKIDLTVDSCLKNHGNTNIPIPAISIETTLKFKSLIDLCKDSYLKVLQAEYEKGSINVTMISQMQSEQEYINREIAEFSKLMEMDTRLDEWGYLIKRLQLSGKDEILSLYQCGIELLTDGYLGIIQSFNHEKQMLAAKYLAICEYIGFLNEKTTVLDADGNSDPTNEEIKAVSDKSIDEFAFKVKGGMTTDMHLILADMMKSLIKFKFIATETGLVAFKQIFSGAVLKKKIVWIGNAADLTLFIKGIEPFIEFDSCGKWKTVVNCFIPLTGTYSDTSIRKYDEEDVDVERLKEIKKCIDHLRRAVK